MTDRLSLANALADAKIDRPAAERIAPEIFDAITSNVATKADIARLDGSIAQRRTEIALIEHRLLTRLGSLAVVLAGVIVAAIRYLPPVH